MSATSRRTSLMTMLCAMIALIVILQMWLVSACLDALLGGETGVLLPGALASLGLALGAGTLLLLGLRHDRGEPPARTAGAARS